MLLNLSCLKFSDPFNIICHIITNVKPHVIQPPLQKENILSYWPEILVMQKTQSNGLISTLHLTKNYESSFKNQCNHKTNYELKV